MRPALETFEFFPEAPCSSSDVAAVEAHPSTAHGRHPAGWPHLDPSHKIVRREPGEVRCDFCDCRPRDKAARLPCDAAPANWRNATTTAGS